MKSLKRAYLLFLLNQASGSSTYILSDEDSFSTDNSSTRIKIGTNKTLQEAADACHAVTNCKYF